MKKFRKTTIAGLDGRKKAGVNTDGQREMVPLTGGGETEKSGAKSAEAKNSGAEADGRRAQHSGFHSAMELELRQYRDGLSFEQDRELFREPLTGSGETEKGGAENAEMKNSGAEADSRRAWHPGFYSAMELELRRYRDGLSFEQEHELYREPLIVDMLIIRKDPELRINNPVARIFRERNLIEYKGPTDYLSVDAFFHALSYVYLYKAHGEKENSIRMRDITFSAFCDRVPKGLFKTLRESGLEIKEKSAGIYSVRGFPDLAAQVVVIGKLPVGEHPALRILRIGADREDVKRFLEETAGLTQRGDRDRIGAVLRLSMAVNQELYRNLKEEKGMLNVEAAARYIFPELFEEGKAEGIAEGKAEGIAEGKNEIVAEMLRDRAPVGLIEKYTRISAEQIAEIARSIGVSPVT